MKYDSKIKSLEDRLRSQRDDDRIIVRHVTADDAPSFPKTSIEEEGRFFIVDADGGQQFHSPYGTDKWYQI